MQHKKYDDTKWHQDDAGNNVQAAVHIALYFMWLLCTDKVQPEVLKAWGVAPSAVNDREHSPTWYLFEYSDGKLLSKTMDNEAAMFTNYFYEQYYLVDVTEDSSELNLQRIANGRPPYDIEDSWPNVEIVEKYLNRCFTAWKAGHKPVN